MHWLFKSLNVDGCPCRDVRFSEPHCVIVCLKPESEQRQYVRAFVRSEVDISVAVNMAVTGELMGCVMRGRCGRVGRVESCGTSTVAGFRVPI
jgi:hypothetical protein